MGKTFVKYLSANEINPQIRMSNYVCMKSMRQIGPRYIHDYQMFYIVKGEGRCQINDAVHKLFPGVLVLYGPGDMHHFISSELVPLEMVGMHFSWIYDESRDAHDYHRVVHFEKDLERGFIDEYVKADFLPKIPFVLNFPHEINEQAKKIFIEFGREFKYFKNAKTLHYKGAFLGLMELCAEQASRENDSSRHVKIEEFIRMMSRDFAKKTDRRKAAKKLGVSESHLTHLLKKELNSNFTRYLDDIRMSNAYDLVLYSNLPLKDIARQSGFDDAGYFSKKFAARFGKPPGAYRLASASSGFSGNPVTPRDESN